MNNQFDTLLMALMRDLERPDYWWEIAALLICLVAAKLAARLVLKRKLPEAYRSDRAWQVGQGGINRIAFPVFALLLLLPTRSILSIWYPVSLLSIAIPLLVSLALIRTIFYVLRYSFNPSGWLAGLERTIAMLVWGLVAVHIVGWLPQLIALLESVSLSVGKQKLDLWMIAQGVVTVVITLLIALWLSGLVDARLAKAETMDSNLRVVFSRFTKAILMLLAVMIGLPLVGIDLTTLSVFSGALGVGLGFGLQKIASNYVSGFIILLDRSIRIGNMIAVVGERGQVTRISARYTILRNLSGVEVVVPNEILVSSVVRNESLDDPKVQLQLRVQVSNDSDVEHAMRLMEQAALAQPRVLKEPAAQAGIVEFADNGILLEVGFWITDPHTGTGALRSDINLAIWKAFRAAGVEIPYPQREVRLIGATAAAEVQ